MSYNGIGLKSAKGSSTSGHVQKSLVKTNDSLKNKNYLKRKKRLGKTKENLNIDIQDIEHSKTNKLQLIETLMIEKPGNNKSNKDISNDTIIQAEHDRNISANNNTKILSDHEKRTIELKVQEYIDILEDKYEDDDTISRKADEYRQNLIQESKKKTIIYKTRKERSQ
ncbi:U2-type spliceosomal complex subunit CWC21 SCDLUD_001972 [Saccharomycodes ludwigii]|uniref:U2-type spliceosomal complex subunit CWC21 n=1 Tax=Saccharomycodes ludwigii TaxID=36035 RepID=UPI001E89D58A|nr:hypothetical protein SCDLUD_001972 [Saccharomycodes ludwigii]KAH3902159.1 hypothetical protein SCDLUD_001972 [Saccharomycodes ludwigii]